jgi:anti-sigma factor RsiW
MGDMSCERMESRILGYMDGRLKDSERAEVEKHLAACAICRVRANEFRSVNDLLGEMPVIAPSPAFDVRVRARVAAEPVKQSWWAWMRPSPRIAFAASMLLLATVFVSYHSTQVPPPPIAVNADDPDTGIMPDISVLEDHDALSNFEPLKELPAPVDQTTDTDSDNQM